MDQEYTERMQTAIEQARRNIDAQGWYLATEEAAEDYEVSLPELQRALTA